MWWWFGWSLQLHVFGWGFKFTTLPFPRCHRGPPSDMRHRTSQTYVPHGICTVFGKNIPDIIDSHLKKEYPILIILCTNISGTTGHQMTIPYSTSSIVCFCTTWGNRTNKMGWNEQNYVKKHSQRYRLWLEELLTDFNNFWCKHFWHYLPSNNRSSFHLTKCLLLHYLGKPEQAK